MLNIVITIFITALFTYYLTIIYNKVWIKRYAQEIKDKIMNEINVRDKEQS
jgi:hypothetical protein